MIYIKMALKSMRSFKMRYVILINQITAVLFALNFVVASINNQYSQYLPYEEMLSKKGFYFTDIQTTTDDNYIPLESVLSDKASIFEIRSLGYAYDMISPTDYKAITIYIYEDEFYEKLNFSLQSGKKNADNVSKTPSAVITQNVHNIGVGDYIKMPEYNQEIHVSGVMTAPTYIANQTRHKYNGNVSTLYQKIAADNGNTVFVLMSQSEFSKLGIPLEETISVSNKIIFYDDVDIATIEKDLANLNERGYCTELSQIKKATTDNINSILFKYIPLIAAVLIVVLYGVVNYSAIQAMSKAKINGVFFLCGMTQKQCVATSAANTAIVLIISVILNALIFLMLTITNAVHTVGLVFDAYNIFVTSAIILIIFAFGLIMPTLLINRKRIVSTLGGRV